MGPPRNLIVVALLAGAGLCPGASAAPPAPPRARLHVTFEERVRAQEAIERVYHSRRIGAPPFERAVPQGVLERKVDDALRLSSALEVVWNTPVTIAALDREMDRIAAATRFPDRLTEIREALDNDPALIRETFARETLVNRLARAFFGSDERLHHTPAEARPISFDQWWEASRLDFPPARTAPPSGAAPRPAAPRGDAPADRFDAAGTTLREEGPAAACGLQDQWARGPGFGVPPGRTEATSVWTGSEMIVWGGDNLNVGRSGGRYDPLTDVWRLTPVQGAPSQRIGHTAVWTGQEMIIWGGGGGGTPSDTGGRYDPVTDMWRPTGTTGAPQSRRDHTAVWTGTEMIVWGGSFLTNTGGRYDPETDTWTPTTLVNAPAPRQDHVAVWTGEEMIVYAGLSMTTGGRYDPATDSWTPTTTVGTPDGRDGASAVWTGQEMIIWGGSTGGILPTGGRYNPTTDSWTPTSLVNAPANRGRHAAVWAGDRMIVWGGTDSSQPGPSSTVNTGGTYDPATDTWAATTLVNAPAPRTGHTGVWADGLLIVWGGTAGTTGGRYHAGTDSWTPTSTASPVPTPRRGHTAVWTGGEMIIWGGSPGPVATGARWNPLTGEWTPTSLLGAPVAREDHTAVWSGDEMIIWGGVRADAPGNELDDGARYNPVADSWAPVPAAGSPSPRSLHSAVWTGDEMIIWGGDASWFDGGELSDGARYDPGGDVWTGMSSMNAPSARAAHAAVWTGTGMIVTGGTSSGTPGRYAPATDTWTPTSAAGAPTALFSTAVWTGTEMIVWGGGLGTGTGRRYDPSADLWAPTSSTGAPQGRFGHAAVWTGREMIVWGGITVAGGFGSPIINHLTGGRYDPRIDTWIATSLSEAPQGRFEHTLVWTGAAMVPWGGSFYSGDVLAGVTQGEVAWYGGGPLPPPDADGDGYSICDGDCDDADPATHPGAVDLPGDSADEDCAAGPLCDPAAGWNNRGSFVSCVARECNRLMAEGTLGAGQCGRIVSGAARGAARRIDRP